MWVNHTATRETTWLIEGSRTEGVVLFLLGRGQTSVTFQMGHHRETLCLGLDVEDGGKALCKVDPQSELDIGEDYSES